MPRSGGVDVVAYLRGVAPVAPAKGPRPAVATPETPAAAPNGLVLRDLEDGKERTFADVTEFTLSKDGRWLG